MTTMYNERNMVHPISGSGFTTEHAAAVVVIGALVFLIAIRRGFRGVGLPGVASVRVGG